MSPFLATMSFAGYRNVNAPGAMLKCTHPQVIAPVRLQGQGVRNSINSVRDEKVAWRYSLPLALHQQTTGRDSPNSLCIP